VALYRDNLDKRRLKKEIIIHFIIDKAVLKFGNEVWVLKESDEQTLEASQMKFFN